MAGKSSNARGIGSGRKGPRHQQRADPSSQGPQFVAKVARSQYEKQLRRLQEELNAKARWVKETGQRLLIIFEGRDTAGKGGAIRSIADRLNPRMCRVVALAKPSEREATQMYAQRYIAHLPAEGEIVLFDRSWYNRAGVERVMGYTTEDQVKSFLKRVPELERTIVDDGILLFKYFLTCDQKEQEKRLQDRLHDPLKRWKLSPIDLEARDKYGDYTRAREAMLKATHTKFAPWTLVDFNDQKIGRLTLLRHLIESLPAKARPLAKITLPPLSGRAQREQFKTLKPIPAMQG
jgi:polyphosphate kinase